MPASRKIAIEVRPRAAGDTVSTQSCHKRAGERRDRQQLGLQEADMLAEPAVGEYDRRRGCKRAAGGDADQAGIGERVAEQPLHDGAGGAEQGADHRGGCDARNPDRPQHELVARERGTGRAVAPEPERGRQPCERNSGGTDGERDQCGTSEHDRRQASVSAAEGRRAYPLRRAVPPGWLSAKAVIAGNSPSARPAQTSPPAAPAPDTI